MLFKSMRDVNSSFKSDMLNSQNEQFYRQMQDDQMAKKKSCPFSVLRIWLLLSYALPSDATEDKVRSEGFDTSLERPQYSGRSEERASEVQSASAVKQPASSILQNPFVTSMKPTLARRAHSCWFVTAIGTSGTWNRLGF